MNSLNEFFDGFLAPVRGAAFLGKHPRLWQYAVWPIVINLFLTALVLGGLIAGVAWLSSYWEIAWQRALAVILFGVLALALAAVVWLVLQAVLCAWFYFELARETEMALGRPRESLREAPLLRQIWDALVTSLRLVGVNLALLLLNVVPIVGTALATVGCVLCNAWVLGASHLDYPLSLRAKIGREKREFLKHHRPATFGLGTAVLLLLLVPFVGALLLTTAVVGAVLLYESLDSAASRVDDAPGGAGDERSRHPERL